MKLGFVPLVGYCRRKVALACTRCSEHKYFLYRKYFFTAHRIFDLFRLYRVFQKTVIEEMMREDPKNVTMVTNVTPCTYST